MPYSNSTFDQAIKDFIINHRMTKYLDIGAGAGKYGSMIKKAIPLAFVEAVEIDKKYIIEFQLHKIYNMIHERRKRHPRREAALDQVHQDERERQELQRLGDGAQDLEREGAVPERLALAREGEEPLEYRNHIRITSMPRRTAACRQPTSAGRARRIRGARRACRIPPRA